MKKLLAALVFLALLIPVAAARESRLYRQEDGGIVRGLWMRDGVLHLFAQGAYFTWAGGGAAMEAHALDLSLPAGESVLAFIPGNDDMHALVKDRDANARICPILLGAAAQHMHVRHYFGIDEGGGSEFSTQIVQYLDGAIDAETMLRNLDKKITMMLLED